MSWSSHSDLFQHPLQFKILVLYVSKYIDICVCVYVKYIHTYIYTNSFPKSGLFQTSYLPQKST